MSISINSLNDESFDSKGTVVVHTRMCSSFTIVRLRRGTYIAYNRTEWATGCKVFRGIDEMRKDLSIR